MKQLTIFIAIVCLLAYAMVSTITCNGLKASRSRVEDNASSLRDSLHQFVTKAGILTAYTKAQEGTITELKATNGAIVEDREIKLNLKDRQIEGAQNVIAKMSIEFKDLVNMTRRGDTVETVDHVDSNNAFHAVVTEDTAGARTIHVTDTPTVDLHLTEYQSKWNILKPLADPTHYIGAYSNNCEVRITGLESVLVIKEKQKAVRTIVTIGLGVAAGLFMHTLLK